MNKRLFILTVLKYFRSILFKEKNQKVKGFKCALISAILIFLCPFFVLPKAFAQTADPQLEYLQQFHQNEAEYRQQLYMDNPDLSREALREKMREYYRENFDPPIPKFEEETSIQKTSANMQLSAQTIFNQVPDSIEYQALRALFESTNGPDWTNSDNWDYPIWKDPSTVTYSDFEDWYGVTEGDVSAINLEANSLSGDLPNEISDLSSLQYLFMHSNQLTGSIPPTLGSLISLAYLSLSNNQLSGSIPSELGGLSSLENLYLGGNQLTGSIPPALGNLSSSTRIYLGSNQLTGPIPPELGNHLSLAYLNLSYNQLVGTIPIELANLPLEYLYLDNNHCHPTKIIDVFHFL